METYRVQKKKKIGLGSSNKIYSFYVWDLVDCVLYNIIIYQFDINNRKYAPTNKYIDIVYVISAYTQK